MRFPPHTKIFLQAILVLILPVILSDLSAAQPSGGPCFARKFAFYDGNALREKDGVTRLHRAYEAALELGFHSERDPEKLKAMHDRSQSLIVGPVLADVRAALGRLGESNGAVLVDIVPLDESGMLLAIDRRPDVTRPLTSFLNRARGTKDSKMALAVGPARVGVVDSTRFPRGWDATAESRKRVWEYSAEYVQAKKLGALLDSSRGSRELLSGSNGQDVTANFLADFNRRFAQNGN